MVEVSQATTIIHEAAHEDANIIFGAVVDPTMDGKVKITVIATDFEGRGGRRAAAAGADTPVDLQQFANQRQEENAAPMAVAAAGGGGIAMSRRTTIEFALPDGPVVDSEGADDGAAPDAEAEDEPAPLPAFLRSPAE